MGALLVSWLIPLAIELPFSFVMSEHPTLLQNIVYVVAELLIALLYSVVSAGIARIHLHMARKQQYELKMVFFGFREQTDRFLLTGIFYFLALAAGLLPFFAGYAAYRFLDGAVRYAALGILSAASLVLLIVLMLNIALTIYLVIDAPEQRVWDCLVKSVRSMRKHKCRLLYLCLSFLGLQFLNLLSFGIGSLWVAPYQSQTLANFYLDATGQLPASSQPAPGSPEYRPFHEYL